MITILFLFIILSTLAATIVVAACIQSAKITHWEDLPEVYEAETEGGNEPIATRLPLLQSRLAHE